MGPKTGPRPASSTPKQTGVPDAAGESDSSGVLVFVDEAGGRSVEGTGEKYVYESPERMAFSLMEGGTKAPGTGVSRAISSTIGESSIVTGELEMS